MKNREPTPFEWMGGLIILSIGGVLIAAFVTSCFNGSSSDRSSRPRSSIYTPELVCQNALRSAVNYPRTIRFPFGGYEVDEQSGNRASVTQRFSAENAFGVRVDFIGECSVQGNTATVMSVRELR